VATSVPVGVLEVTAVRIGAMAQATATPAAMELFLSTVLGWPAAAAKRAVVALLVAVE
jgi:hypothetical protein